MAAPHLLPPSAAHERFLAWAAAHGITTSRIRPAAFPAAGLGIVSTGPIPGPAVTADKAAHRLGHTPGEAVAFTPTAALLTLENARAFAPALPSDAAIDAAGGLTTHALLAAAIACQRANDANDWRPWIDVWPSLHEFRAAMPLLWPPAAQALLPPSARSLLEPQEAKFAKDWAAVSALLDGADFQFDRDDYTWAWLVVNTRSLFYKLDTERYAQLARDDCMALCPFIDYFNHSDSGCKVELSEAGYTVTTTGPVAAADTPLHVSYGAHSNDFLLVEYGFVLPAGHNRWDDVLLDSYVLPALAPAHREHLASEGFLGNYVLDRAVGFCYRTHAAVRMLLVPAGAHAERAMVAQWRKVLRGEDEGERERPRVDAYLRELLVRIKTQAAEALVEVAALDDGNVRSTLESRWQQILDTAEEVERDMAKTDEGEPMRKYMM